MIRLLPLLLLAACKSMPISCANAAKIRAAAEVTVEAIDRACPSPWAR